MNKIEQKDFIDMLQSTLEVYGSKLTPASVSIWIAVMGKYNIGDVRDSLAMHIGSSSYAPKPSDLINIINARDGRPSADEAWAMVPQNESVSAVLSQEMLTAMGSSQPLLNEGDAVAARMAFKAAYTRLVNEARATSRPAEWFPSLGDDKFGRQEVIKEAVRLGRLSVNHATKLLPFADFSTTTKKLN